MAGLLAVPVEYGCSAGPAHDAAAHNGTAPSPAMAPITVTHGVATGDVTSGRAVIWSRADRYACMHVTVEGGGQRRHRHAWVTEAHDFAGKLVVDGLTPDTGYRYTVGFSGSEHAEPAAPALSTGSFRTAPDSGADRDIVFGYSGDLGGLNVCRDLREGYPIFRTIDGAALSFFIGLGDMIYADMACTERGFYGNAQIPGTVAEATTVREYWAHWKYNRADAGFQRLLASTGYYGVWDDHEVCNDFSPNDAWHRYAPYVIGADLLPLGRRALLDYNPIYEDAAGEHPLYGAYRWGRHLELIVLDTRSHRSDDVANDSDEAPKTLLGEAQRKWFERTVLESDATWKVVVSSVPISIPTGRGAIARDGWANFDGQGGSERELARLLRSFRDRGVRRLVWLTTDVHFATGLAYTPFPETPEFRVYEFSAGPLGAMLLPNQAKDETFHPERLFFFGPSSGPKSFDEAKQYMNWGKVTVSRRGSLTVSIQGGLGAEVARATIDEDGRVETEPHPLGGPLTP